MVNRHVAPHVEPFLEVQGGEWRVLDPTANSEWVVPAVGNEAGGLA